MNLITIISCGYFNECKAGIVFGKGPDIIAAEAKKTSPTTTAVSDMKPIIHKVTPSVNKKK